MAHLQSILKAMLASALAASAAACVNDARPSFDNAALAEPAQIVDCTLMDGSSARCQRVVVNYMPDDLEIGPFCPATLDNVGGIWEWTGEGAGLYRIDGDFLRMLSSLGYKFYDDNGAVHIVDTATSQPSVDHACINVSPDTSVKITALIPIHPVRADAPSPLGVVGKVGMALNGVPIFSDAPSIQQTGHMPALDTCGGHIDPGGWYHWHATATDIETSFAHEHVDAACGLEQDPSAMFGYAFDGFPMYGSADADGAAPTDLDACNGHTGATREFADAIYHYHASADFPNLPACLVGVQAQGNFVTTAQVGVGANPPEGASITRRDPPGGGRPGPGEAPPGFQEAADALDVSLDELMRALEAAGGPQLDFANAAAALGVSEDRLREVLPPPPSGERPVGGAARPGQQP